MPRHRHRAIKESTRRYYKCLNLLELVKLFVPQQQMYKAKACAQRMCPMKSTCWPYPNEYCEMLTISNGYLRARQRTHGTMALRMALGHTWTWLHDEYLNCMTNCEKINGEPDHCDAAQMPQWCIVYGDLKYANQRGGACAARPTRKSFIWQFDTDETNIGSPDIGNNPVASAWNRKREITGTYFESSSWWMAKQCLLEPRSRCTPPFRLQ